MKDGCCPIAVIYFGVGFLRLIVSNLFYNHEELLVLRFNKYVRQTLGINVRMHLFIYKRDFKFFK